MNLTQAWVEKLLQKGGAASIKSHVFDSVEAGHLHSYLEKDALNYIYSASISIADAINGILRLYTSWATVKLYYCVFYTCRGLLALSNHVGLIYIGKAPYIIEAQSGSKLIKKKGQTHKIILNEFKARNPSHSLISQEIMLQSPLEWLIERREFANYKNPRFWEPETPDHFRKIINVGVRKSISAYVADFDAYAFDPEHAILAYPIKCLKVACEKLNSSGNVWEDDSKKYIINLFKDSNGPLAEIKKIF